MLKKIRKYEPEQKIRERFVKYRKGKKIKKDELYKASKTQGQKRLLAYLKEHRMKVKRNER